MPVTGDQIQFNGSTSGYPSLVQDGTTATPVNFPFGPWPAASYLLVYLTGAYSIAPEDNKWVAGNEITGGPSTGGSVITDGSASINCGPIINNPYVNQAAVQAAAALVANGTYWVQSSSGSIGVKTLDNPYTDNVNGSPSPTYALIPYPVVLSITTTAATPCGGVSGAVLTWPSSLNSTGYTIYRSTVSGSGYVQIGTTTGLTYTDTPISPGIEYYYVVTQTTNGYASPFSNEVNTGTSIVGITPSVLSSTVMYFNSGANQSIGKYIVSYLNGSYQFAATTGEGVNSNEVIPSPDGITPAGYQITDGAGNISPAPGNANQYATQALAEAGNAGLKTTFQHVGGKPIGIYLWDRPYSDNVAASPAPTFYLCGPLYATLAVSPGSITAPGSTTLSWTTTGATAASLDNGIGTVSVGSGSISVSPTALSTTYTLTVTGIGMTYSTSVTVTVTRPSTPTNLVATGLASSQIMLSWSASSNVTGYIVKRSAAKGGPYTSVGTPAGTTFTDTVTIAGTTYYYVVEGTDGVFNSADSNEASAASLVPVSAAPTALSAAPFGGRVVLTYTAPAWATSINIYRGATSGGETLLTTGASLTGYTDRTTTDGVVYFYTVAGVNVLGIGPHSSEVNALPQNGINPYVPVAPPDNTYTPETPGTCAVYTPQFVATTSYTPETTGTCAPYAPTASPSTTFKSLPVPE